MKKQLPRFWLRPRPEPVHVLEPGDLEGQDVTIPELLDALKRYTRGAFELDRRTLIWYASLGLIKRAGRKWRTVYYPYRSIWDLYAISIFRTQYNWGIETIRQISDSGAPLYETLFSLYNLEQKVLLRIGFSQLFQLVRALKREYVPMDAPDKLIRVAITKSEAEEMDNELVRLSFGRINLLTGYQQSLRDSFFEMVIGKVDPTKIDVEFEEE